MIIIGIILVIIIPIIIVGFIGRFLYNRYIDDRNQNFDIENYRLQHI